MDTSTDNWDYFWSLGIETVKQLETERGILASAKHELFGCIFGRDSLITSLQLLTVYQRTHQDYFLSVVRKVLITLSELQGKDLNIESGEQPGKVIHEYRPEGHEHLTKPNPNSKHIPWYVYPDQQLRNYDTVDATALFLITIYRYWQAVEQNHHSDPQFQSLLLPSVKAAINWIFWYGDSNGDDFIDYQFAPDRTFGGLHNHNWMDSDEATFHEDGSPVIYPLAPSETQAYTYLALKLWANYFDTHPTRQNRQAAEILHRKAQKLKTSFNARFIQIEPNQIFVASAIDGQGKPLLSVRSSMGHCLWASLNPKDDGLLDGIVDAKYIDAIVKRLLAPDLFVPDAGIRTLSQNSTGFAANSYHNGSIWPHDNSMIADGLEVYSYYDEAQLVRVAMLKTFAYFNAPLELFVFEHELTDYASPTGQKANRSQAWSAAALLNTIAHLFPNQVRS
jgi:glycogen debranching enzyme